MAWIYLAESADAQKVWRNGSDQLPIVKTIQRNNLCWYHGCSGEVCPQHRSGTTLELFEEKSYPRSISFLEDFLARICRLQDFARVWALSDQVFFGKLSDLPKKWRHVLSSWRMSGQESGNSFPPSELRLKHLDFDAEMVSLRLPISARATDDKDGSSLLPTLTASRSGYNQGGGSGRVGKKRYSLEMLWKMGKLPTATATAREWRCASSKADEKRKSPSLSYYWKATTGTNMPPSFCEWIMGYHIGDTVLEPWAIHYHRSNTVRRSKNYQESMSVVSEPSQTKGNENG
jgi:hypothetical protein